VSPLNLPGDKKSPAPSPQATPAGAARSRARSAPSSRTSGTPGLGSTDPRRSSASPLGSFSRLLRGWDAAALSPQDVEFAAAAREAYRSAQSIVIGRTPTPSAPVPDPARFTAPASAPVPDPARFTAPASELAVAAGRGSDTGTLVPSPEVTAPPAPTSGEAAPAVAADGSVARSAPGEQPTSPRQHRVPGELAPDFLVQAPSGATRAVDDFLDDLLRRTEAGR
jgi:hypothetical protein